MLLLRPVLDEVNAKHYEKNGRREDCQYIHTMVPITIQKGG